MKKELKPLTVGNQVVHLQLRESDDEQFLIVGAQCGETQGEASLTLHLAGEHTAATLDRDVAEAARRLAGETAAKELTRLLRKSLFKEG